MKLTLILEDKEGQKIERNYQYEDFERENEGGYLWDAVSSMADSLEKSKKPL
jgi:hypothetical protein